MAASSRGSCGRRFSASSLSIGRTRNLLLQFQDPEGFLPEEDQGAFFVELQAAGRLDGGENDGRRGKSQENIVRRPDGVEDVTTAIGFSLLNGLAQSNSVFMVVRLRPFEERTDPKIHVSPR